jgi:hypothetical protein
VVVGEARVVLVNPSLTFQVHGRFLFTFHILRTQEAASSTDSQIVSIFIALYMY